MFNINDYLAKFRHLTSHEGQVRDAVVALLHEQYGVSVDREAIRYSRKCIFVQTHPAVKNEILMNKRTLLEMIRARVSCVVSDIK